MFNVFTSRVSVCRWFAAVALVFVSVASAQTVPSASSDAAFGKFMFNTVGAGQTSVSFGTNGNPLSVPSAATLSTDGAAGVKVARTGVINNPAGVPLTVGLGARIGNTAVGALVKKALPLVPVLGTGVALYDLAVELGYVPSKVNGQLVVQKNTATCTTAPCYEYVGNTTTCNVGAWHKTASAAGQSCAALMTQSQYYTYLFVSADATTLYINKRDNSNGVLTPQNVPLISRTRTPDAATYSPSTVDALADSIAASSGWPVSSAVSRAVAQALPLTGDAVATATPLATGPATSAGKTTTTNNADGTKVVNTTTYNHSYAGNTITTGATTTTNNYNASNVITTTTTTTATADPVTAPAEPTKTQCEASPDTLGCAKFGDAVTQTLATADSGFNAIQAVSFSSSAACPASDSFSVAGRSFSVSYAPICGAATDYIRPVVIVLGAALAMFVFIGGFKQ